MTRKIKPLTDERLLELAKGSMAYPAELKVITALQRLPFEERLDYFNKVSFFGPATY